MENLHYEDRLKHLELTRLDRKSRSHLIETFKIISGMYDIRQELFFDFDEGGRRGHSKNLSKEGVGLTLESLSTVTELLTNGTHFRIVALTALRFIVSSHIFRNNWNRKQVYINCQFGEWAV